MKSTKVHTWVRNESLNEYTMAVLLWLLVGNMGLAWTWAWFGLLWVEYINGIYHVVLSCHSIYNMHFVYQNYHFTCNTLVYIHGYISFRVGVGGIHHYAMSTSLQIDRQWMKIESKRTLANATYVGAY